MNRHGAMLSATIPGGVTYPILDTFLHRLVHSYLIPTIVMLFLPPSWRNNTAHAWWNELDHHRYAFTIQYQRGHDVLLKEHIDDSLMSFNVNLNTQNDTSFVGSNLYFILENGHRQAIRFESGMAVIHWGNIVHAALPIVRGQRHNLVLWLGHGTHK